MSYYAIDSLPCPVQSLLLLHYLIRNGSERVVTSAREHVYDMKPLEEYTFRDEQGKDQGINGMKNLRVHMVCPLQDVGVGWDS